MVMARGELEVGGERDAVKTPGPGISRAAGRDAGATAGGRFLAIAETRWSEAIESESKSVAGQYVFACQRTDSLNPYHVGGYTGGWMGGKMILGLTLGGNFLSNRARM